MKRKHHMPGAPSSPAARRYALCAVRSWWSKKQLKPTPVKG